MDNKEIFKGKTYDSLLEDIYNNSKKKERDLSKLIKELEPLIKNLGDATVIVPLIKEYMELAIRNDEHLIKMAAIVQRSMAKSGAEGGDTLSEEEKRQLMAQIQDLASDG